MNSRRPDKRVSTLIINYMSKKNGNKPNRKERALALRLLEEEHPGRKPKNHREFANRLHRQEQLLSQIVGQPNRVMSDKTARNYHNTGLGKDRAPRKPRKPAGASKVTLPMAPGFSEFLKANSSAFTNKLAPPFATSNPQPSIANRASRATAVRTIDVDAGKQIVFRFGISDTISMDGNAYHIKPFVDSFGVYRWTGPYAHSTGAGLIHPSLGIMYIIGNVDDPVTPTLTGNTPLIPQAGWPLDTNDTIGPGTQRYVPTCWTMNVINETILAERGGDFVTCLPASSSAIGSIRVEDLVRFGSYKEHSSNQVDFHVPVRPVDLAYRHLFENPTSLANAEMSNPAGYLVFRNTTTKKQTLRIYGGTKYTVAGSLPATLLDPADHSPNHSGHYENISAAVTAGQVHPTALHEAGQTVMKAIHEGTSVLAAIGEKGLAVGKAAALKAISVGASNSGFQL